MRRQEAIKFPGIRGGGKVLTEQTEKIAICSEYNFRLCFSVPPVLVRFVHLKSFVFPASSPPPIFRQKVLLASK